MFSNGTGQRTPMKNKKNDRRVQRTQRALHKALMSRILEKKYDTITVQEILDLADVGRSTFYTHFQDKDALLVNGLENVKGLLATAQTGAAERPGKSYERIIGFSLPMFEHAFEFRAVNRALFGSGAEVIVRRQIQSALIAVVSPEVKQQFQKRKVGDCTVSPELLTYFLVSTYISVLNWWLNTKNSLQPREIDQAYRQLVMPCLASIFA